MCTKPTAVIRTTPEDFVVEEIPAYQPAGEGDHLFVLVRKTRLTTSDCVRWLSEAGGVQQRDIGYAGMKDKWAVTTQWLSLPPRAGPIEVGQVAEGLEVLETRKNPTKLRIGHLVGNRFKVVLRELRTDAVVRVKAECERVAVEGFPNAFGPQRFGRDGDNPERALDWLRGKSSGPREHRTQRLLFSSVQALMFDAVLRERLRDGTWNTVLMGDVAKRADSGGLFECTEAAVDADRASRGEISATGPIFGSKMRWPSGAVAELERKILVAHVGSEEFLKRHGRLGEGTRRLLRVFAKRLQVAVAEMGSNATMELQFDLPKGSYATTLLAQMVELKDASLNRQQRADLGNTNDGPDRGTVR